MTLPDQRPCVIHILGTSFSPEGRVHHHIGNTRQQLVPNTFHATNPGQE